jgi:peroxiredoxin
MQRRDFALRLTALAAAPALGGLPLTAMAAGVGQPAPLFALRNTQGQTVRLEDFKGKPVVLEWTNPGCPFVRKHYQGNMQALQKAYTARGVAWLTVNSTETASADYLAPAALAQWMSDQHASPTAVLMDEDGRVGKTYGARVTPHMYLINAEGVLVYAGAIDSIASARVADIERATNYVRQGLDELLAGRPLSVSVNQAYGCTIKYKS